MQFIFIVLFRTFYSSLYSVARYSIDVFKCMKNLTNTRTNFEGDDAPKIVYFLYKEKI